MSTQQGDVEAIFHQAWPLPSIRGEVHREEAASRLDHAPVNDSLIERHVDHRDDQSMQLQQTPLPRSPLPHSLPLPTQLVSVPQQPRPLENVQMTAQLLYSETDVVVGAMKDTCSQRTGAWTGNLELVKDEMAYGHLGQHRSRSRAHCLGQICALALTLILSGLALISAGLGGGNRTDTAGSVQGLAGLASSSSVSTLGPLLPPPSPLPKPPTEPPQPPPEPTPAPPPPAMERLLSSFAGGGLLVHTTTCRGKWCWGDKGEDWLNQASTLTTLPPPVEPDCGERCMAAVFFHASLPVVPFSFDGHVSAIGLLFEANDEVWNQVASSTAPTAAFPHASARYCRKPTRHPSC